MLEVSGERHGGPQPMIAGQVIPGFAEALTKMQKGGKYKIHIPGKLAYGETPPPGSPFGPNADLDFDVHIVQIVPNAALMSGGGEAPGGGQPQQAPQPEQAPTP
jgi:FKBP-type peptidyl-prolyl cis-trans isomerase FkpA